MHTEALSVSEERRHIAVLRPRLRTTHLRMINIDNIIILSVLCTPKLWVLARSVGVRPAGIEPATASLSRKIIASFGSDRNWTCNRQLKRLLLYQLSYGPKRVIVFTRTPLFLFMFDRSFWFTGPRKFSFSQNSKKFSGKGCCSANWAMSAWEKQTRHILLWLSIIL